MTEESAVVRFKKWSTATFGLLASPSELQVAHLRGMRVGVDEFLLDLDDAEWKRFRRPALSCFQPDHAGQPDAATGEWLRAWVRLLVRQQSTKINRLHQEPRVLFYPAAVALSQRTLQHLADLIRHGRNQRRSRWRRLPPGDQALLVLAHLRNGDTHARLGAGFGVSTATAWRYVQEGIDLLASHAATLGEVVERAARLAHAILDGTLIPIDRVGMASGRDRPYFSGKHHRHGVNLQVLTDPAGRLLWVSPALPGATHDLTAARTRGLIDALTSADVEVFADRGYQGAGGTVRTPFKRHPISRPVLKSGHKAVNRAHARIRAIGERAIATLKDYKILTRLRRCPHRATAIAAAILVLHDVETSSDAG